MSWSCGFIKVTLLNTEWHNSCRNVSVIKLNDSLLVLWRFADVYIVGIDSKKEGRTDRQTFKCSHSGMWKLDNRITLLWEYLLHTITKSWEFFNHHKSHHLYWKETSWNQDRVGKNPRITKINNYWWLICGLFYCFPFFKAPLLNTINQTFIKRNHFYFFSPSLLCWMFFL